MMHDWSFGWGGGGMVFGPLITIILVVVAIVLLVRLIGFGNTASSRPDGPTRAREILDERFAKGEIDQQEYESRRKVLDG